MTFDELKDASQFISQYATQLLGSGVHTSRVVRNTKRMGESLGTEVRMTTFQKTMILTVYADGSDLVYTQVLEIPMLPISFEWNSELSSLSWEAFDKPMSLDVLRAKYEAIISSPKMKPMYVLLLVGFANAAFCRLFNGDWIAVLVVFVSTLVGFYAKQVMLRKDFNHFLIAIISSFIASLCASSALLFDATAQIALATSVLFLIPGVPLINGVIDIVEGHILIGTSRIINALLLVISISAGLYFTLLLVKNSLL